MLLGVVLVLSSLPDGVPRPGLDVVGEAFGVKRVALVRVRGAKELSLAELRTHTEFVISTLAMSWLIERSFGCQAFVREDGDGALQAAELLEIASALGTARSSRWSYWALHARWLHEDRFSTPSRAIAEKLDAFVEEAARQGRTENSETEWAALLAIASWERLSAPPRGD